MKVECVAFHTVFRDDAKKTLIGTAKVLLPEIGIEIRGCQYTKRKSKVFASLPHKTDYSNGIQKIAYPTVSFTSYPIMHQLKKNLIKAVAEYVEKTVLSTPLEGVIDNSRKTFNQKLKSPPSVEGREP